MSLKTKTGAVLLALFLGDFGAHWFYLERAERGLCYLVGWPACVVLFMMGGLWAGFLLLALFAGAFLVICRWYDVFVLSSMHISEFDREFNGGPTIY